MLTERKDHWLLPLSAKRLDDCHLPERSAISLGLWLWPPVQFLCSWALLSLWPRLRTTPLYDLLFLGLLALWLLNIAALSQLAKGHKRGYRLFYWSALPILPLSLFALYFLRLLAHSKQKSRNSNETLVRFALAAVALSVVLALVLLIAFIVFRGLVAMPLVSLEPGLGLWGRLVQRAQSWSLFFRHSSLWQFLFSARWAPSGQPPSYGILGFIWGSAMVTTLALLLAVPIGLGCAIYIAEFAPKGLARLLRGASDLLAGLPSVIYGFFGSMLIVPLVRNLFPGDQNTGFNAIAGGIILALMIVPTIINVSEVSLRSVPRAMRAGSLALGATHWQTAAKITVPAAVSGILTGIVLGACRAIGETLAVLMVAGNAVKLAWLPIQPTRTLTMNIIAEMAYAQDDPATGSYHLTSLFTTSIVLMIFILSLNLLLGWVRRRIQRRFQPR